MSTKHIIAIVISFCMFQPLLAKESETTLNKKDVAVKAGKIFLYTMGFVMPATTLFNLQVEQQKENKSLLSVTKDNIEKAWACDDNSHVARTSLYMTSSILGCLGYSAYGLYTELTPVIISLFNKIKNRR